MSEMTLNSHCNGMTGVKFITGIKFITVQMKFIYTY